MDTILYEPPDAPARGRGDPGVRRGLWPWRSFAVRLRSRLDRHWAPVPSCETCHELGGLTIANPILAGYSQYDGILVILLTLLAVHAIYLLLAGITQPISDIHGFRQSQTAVSAYWLWRGGPWLAYETPVFGAPWSVPMELPVYQGLLALLRTVGVPIVIGGRIVSFLFFAGLLWPLSVLFRSLNLGRSTYLTVAVLIFASPIYVFWSRTVMIESCALFFSVAWLAGLARLLIRPGARILVVTIAAGVLGINAKSTTFVPFGLLGAALICWRLLPAWRQGPKWIHLFVIAACATPLLSGIAWVAWSDHIKLANPLTAALTSKSLVTWNFGTLAQRLSEDFWLEVIGRRILPHTLGFMSGLGLLVMCASFKSKRLRWPALFAFLGFLLPLLTFTNLHILHNYYQYANAGFLLTAVGFGVVSIGENGRPRLALLALAVLIGGQLLMYWFVFAPSVTADYSDRRPIRTAYFVKQHTRPDEAVLVFDSEWSSEIAFYSERRTLMVPYWASLDTITGILRDPRSLLGTTKLGAVVYCPDTLRKYPRGAEEIQEFVDNLRVMGNKDGCSVLAPGPARPG